MLEAVGLAFAHSATTSRPCTRYALTPVTVHCGAKVAGVSVRDANSVDLPGTLAIAQRVEPYILQPLPGSAHGT